MITHQFERDKFAQRVKLYLHVEKLSLRGFSELTGVNYNTLHKLVHSKRIWAEHLVTVAYFLDIDLRDYISEIDVASNEVLPRRGRQLKLFKSI